MLKVHWSILNAWTKDATVKMTLKKFWLHRSMSKLLSPLVLSLVGATDTLFMLEKRCGIGKVIIERGGAAKNVIYHNGVDYR